MGTKITDNSALFNALFSPKKEDYFYRVLSKPKLLIFVGAKKSFKIERLPFLDLQPGEKICKIGVDSTISGGQATLNREDKFTPYLTYVGYRYEKMHLGRDEPSKVLLFQVRDEDKPEAVSDSDNYYVAYMVLHHTHEAEPIFELKVPATGDGGDEGVFRIYKPIFTRYE